MVYNKCSKKRESNFSTKFIVGTTENLLFCRIFAKEKLVHLIIHAYHMVSLFFLLYKFTKVIATDLELYGKIPVIK